MEQPPLALQLIRTLREFKKTLSVQYLASRVGRRVEDIEPELKHLERDGAIRREGDTVTLTQG